MHGRLALRLINCLPLFPLSVQDFRCVQCQPERPFSPEMDSRRQSDSDGGGHGRPPSPRGDAGIEQDEAPDPGLSSNGQAPRPPAVLSLDQIRITGSSNEYSEGPVVAQRSPASEHRRQKSDETPEERPNNLRNLPALTQQGGGNASSSSSSRRGSEEILAADSGSPASDRRLLSSQIIRTQPKRSTEELKPLQDEPARPLTAVPGSSKTSGVHGGNKCPDCGRCRCSECGRPRALPSCWMCGRRCMCSAHSAVEYGTCVCCVKGLFYHCSSDDEDTCADKPFSCSQPHCCVRWATVSLLSLLFPCLLCYLPARGGVAACQSCYDRVARPGCRC